VGIRARMAMTGKLVNVAERPQTELRCWVEFWTEGACMGSSHACRGSCSMSLAEQTQYCSDNLLNDGWHVVLCVYPLCANTYLCECV